MLTLTLLFLAALAIFCVLIAAVHAMIGAKGDAAGWAVVALLIAVSALLAGCSERVSDSFRCDGEIVETGKVRIGGVPVPVNRCEEDAR